MTRILSDGSTFGAGKAVLDVAWSSIPHFYHQDRLIVLYSVPCRLIFAATSRESETAGGMPMIENKCVC
jgi:hypothetical protein